MRSILGIDTASPNGSVALAVGGVPAAHEPLGPGGHSSGLSLAAERLLEARGLRFADLGGLAVSEGPGSFTGLRIGLAWAKGIAMGRGLPLVLVSAHEAAAHAHRAPGARVATVTQGERGRVLAALWTAVAESGRSQPLWGPEMVAEDDVMERLEAAARGEPFRVAAPTEALAGLIEALGGTLLPAFPLAPAVAELGDRALREGRTADLAAAAPAYGRAANARKPVR
jgi:tRNA threonylcarbamoyladenosine biosynthesis protein TsaB